MSGWPIWMTRSRQISRFLSLLALVVGLIAPRPMS
jgi:hypothetical protein